MPIPDDPRAFAPEAIQRVATQLDMTGGAAPSVPAALRTIAEAAGTAPCRVLIAGSLYLAGAVLKALRQDLDAGH